MVRKNENEIGGKWIWAAYLSLGAFVICAYFLSPLPAQNVLYLLVALSSAVAVGVGILLNRPSLPFAWCLLALAPLSAFSGDVTYFFHETIFGTAAPYPSLADVFYIVQYLLIIAGLLLIQRQSFGNGRSNMIDPLIVAIGAGLFSWIFLMEPYAEDKSIPLLTKAVALSFPLLNVLLLMVLARLMMAPGKRVPSFYLLSGSMVSLLLADSIYGYQALQGTYHSGGPLEAGWLFSNVLFGMAALHPSMRTLSEPVPASSTPKITRKRLVLLGVASLSAPAILIVQSRLVFRHEGFESYHGSSTISG